MTSIRKCVEFLEMSQGCHFVKGRPVYVVSLLDLWLVPEKIVSWIEKKMKKTGGTSVPDWLLTTSGDS